MHQAVGCCGHLSRKVWEDPLWLWWCPSLHCLASLEDPDSLGMSRGIVGIVKFLDQRCPLCVFSSRSIYWYPKYVSSFLLIICFLMLLVWPHCLYWNSASANCRRGWVAWGLLWPSQGYVLTHYAPQHLLNWYMPPSEAKHILNYGYTKIGGGWWRTLTGWSVVLKTLWWEHSIYTTSPRLSCWLNPVEFCWILRRVGNLQMSNLSNLSNLRSMFSLSFFASAFLGPAVVAPVIDFAGPHSIAVPLTLLTLAILGRARQSPVRKAESPIRSHMPEPIRSLKRWIHFFLKKYLLALYIVFVSHKFVEAMPKGWWRACYFLTFTFERFLLMCEHLNEPEQLLNTSACCFHFAFNYIHFLRIFFHPVHGRCICQAFYCFVAFPRVTKPIPACQLLHRCL